VSGFDTVVVVDWSAAAKPTPKRESADAIWIGVARADGSTEDPVYVRSRPDAEGWLEDMIGREGEKDRRVLVGFDFPFGYPKGLAGRIVGSDDPRHLWDWMAGAFDDLPKGQGRFDLAAKINSSFEEDGPFWFNGLRRDIEGLPRREPRTPPKGIARMRLVEQHAPGAFACWQMGGAGAVGSQAMTGMATLARLRRRLAGPVATWPFEDPDAAPVVLAEIWPSLVREAVARRMACECFVRRVCNRRPIRDAAQVAVLSEALMRQQMRGGLGALLEATAGPDSDRVKEEGWILGVARGANLLLDEEEAADRVDAAVPSLREKEAT
jgi:molybdopterin molybdotransferase